jgi:HAE1 family hydrophobic/amphiphilic exporter-1
VSWIGAFALRQTKLAHAIFLIVTVAGIIAWRGLPIEVYPEIRTSSAVVMVVWPGATAEQVEQLVTRKIEERIQGVRHVSWHRSESTANVSRVVVRFDGGASKSEVDAAFSTLQSRVNQISDWPEGCERPEVTRFKLDEDSPFLRLCVSDTGSRGPLAIREVALELKEELARVPGVANVTLLGHGEREVRVLLDRPRLEDAGLSTPEVAAIIRRSLVSVPVGNVASEEREYPVRFVGLTDRIDELGDIIVRKDPLGAHVYLRDIARVEEGLAQDFIRARYQGSRCIVVEVTKTSGTNIVTVRQQVMELLDRFQEQRSQEGLSVAVAVDITPWVSNALNVMQQNLLAGCVLVLIVLGVFVGLRNSVLAMLGIPFSFLCTLVAMRLLGITLNTTSVFGLVMLSGLIVDDAIVVLENIYRHLQAGVPRREAIVRGLAEVVSPISAAAFTTVMAFLPILVARGGLGSLFADVPKLVTIALLASLFECLIILPGHILHWGPREAAGPADGSEPPSRKRRFSLEAVGSWLARAYLAGLGSLLRLRYLSVLALAALVAFALAAMRSVRVEALPAEFPMAVVNFETSSGASLEATDRLGARICQVVDELAGPDGIVKNYISVAGMQLTEHQELVREAKVGMIWVQFNPTTTARRDPDAMLTMLRERISAFHEDHADLGLVEFTVSSMGTGLEPTEAVAVRVEHRDFEVCRRVADQLRRRLAEIPGVSDVRENMREGPLELNVWAEEPQCSEFGLTFFDVAGAVRAATEGIQAGSLRDLTRDEEVPIRVLFDDPHRDSLDDLLAIRLKTPTGAEPQLEELATLYYDQHYASMYHYNGRRLITVSATIHGKPVDSEGRPIDLRYISQTMSREFPQLQQRYPGLSVTLGGGYAQRQQTLGDLTIAAGIAAGLIYLTLLAQFRSYVQPFLVLLTLLFAFVGVVLGLCIHQYAFSVVTAVSLVGLFGVAVNDAILLIDFINNARAEAADRLAAVVEGCRLRLRPVLATTITTVAGLLPMALGLRGYSSIWSPFAACFCYGLSAATLLTLLILPGVYLISDDLALLTARVFRRRGSGDALAAALPPAAGYEE